MVAGQAADWASTQANGGGENEMNPILKGTSSGEMAVIKAGGTALALYLADRYPKSRRFILITGNVLGWGVTAHNVGK